MEIECGGLGEREIGRDLRHEAGDTRELYSGEFESEEFEAGDTRSSTFSPYKLLPIIANTPTSQKSQFHCTNQSHLPFLISFSHSLNSHIEFFSFYICIK